MVAAALRTIVVSPAATLNGSIGPTPGPREAASPSLSWRQLSAAWSEVVAVAEPRIGPRTNLDPPGASGGNMYLQRAHLTSCVGAVGSSPVSSTCPNPHVIRGMDLPASFRRRVLTSNAPDLFRQLAR